MNERSSFTKEELRLREVRDVQESHGMNVTE